MLEISAAVRVHSRVSVANSLGTARSPISGQLIGSSVHAGVVS